MKPKQLTEGSSLFLDIVRALSVQLVVIGHGISFCGIAMWLQPPSFAHIQNIAVVIFFILSGFLISNSIFLKLSINPNYSFRSYFIDRFSRIYAAFIPALLFILVLDYISSLSIRNTYTFSDSFTIKTFIGNLCMIQDFPLLKHIGLKITSFGSARPLWTLAIEWWIYMWFGVLMIHILKKGKRKLSSFFVFAFLSLIPAYNFFGGRGNGLTLFWLFGVAIILFYDKYKTFQLSKLMKLALLLLILFTSGLRILQTKEAYDALFAILLSGALLIGVDLFSGIQFNKITGKTIRIVANYSYTLYLIHYSIYDFILSHDIGLLTKNQNMVVGFVLSNCLALLIGYFTETKLTKWVKQKLKARFA